MRNKIDSLQALRALAFIGVFLIHCKVWWGWARLSVSIFFCLTGFLMTYSYWDRQMPGGLWASVKFAIRKVRTLYPLHIITLVAMILVEYKLYRFFGTFDSQKVLMFRNAILNIFLLQSWYPDNTVNADFNGVAWYLSVTLFLYVIFPYLLKWMKGKKTWVMAVLAVVLIAVQPLLCYPVTAHYGIGHPVYVWFMYSFPVFRAGEFFAGMVLGRVYLERCCGVSDSGSSVFEVIVYTVAEAALLIFSMRFSYWLLVPPVDNLTSAIKNYTTGFAIMALLWIWVFAKKKGLLTKLASNPVMVALGNISPQAFLIHFAIIATVNAYMALHGIIYTKDMIWKFAPVEFIVTIIVCVLYKKVSSILFKKAL